MTDLNFGGLEAMDVYCNRIQKTVEHPTMDQVHAEHLSDYVTEDAGLDVQYTSTVFERVRSHGYMKAIPEFGEESEKSIKMWGPRAILAT